MRCVVTAILAIGLGTTPGLAGKVAVEFDPATDFAAYRTYQWKPGTAAKRPAADDAVVRAVERELTARGLARVDNHPDVYVVTHVLADVHSLEQLDQANYWEFVTGVRSVDPYDLGAGTLVVDLIDVTRDQVVWRGVASGDVSGPLDKVIRRTDKLIRAMFRQLPQ